MPVFGQCLELMPVFGHCLELMPVFGQCLQLMPVFGHCLQLMPVFGYECLDLSAVRAFSVVLGACYACARGRMSENVNTTTNNNSRSPGSALDLVTVLSTSGSEHASVTRSEPLLDP